MIGEVKIFKLLVQIGEKQESYLSADGYYIVINKDKLNSYNLVSSAKKICTMLAKIRYSKINIEIKLDDYLKLQLIYWINFYLEFYNCGHKLEEDKINNVTYVGDNALIVNSLKIASQTAEIVYDFDHLLNKVNSDINPGNFELYIVKYLQKFNIPFKLNTTICDSGSEFRAIYSIGKSGQFLPRFIRIEIPNRDNTDNPKFCLIGKGITYDTGGYNTKPWKYMLGMHKDKAGALFALFTGILNYLQYGIGSHILLPIAENKINSSAACPGDIVYNYANKAIQIIHTDAEGRVVLSDAISYACAHLKFDYMFTFATLTGAAEMILGPDTGIFMSDSKELVDIALQESQLAGERIWNLPLSDWQKDFIEGDYQGVTCVKNSIDESNADTLLAGAFLYSFFESKASFTHFDIAPLFDKPLTTCHSAAYLIPLVSSIISKLA